MSAIIEFKDVHFKYPEDELESLCGITLAIEEGSFVAVLGHNGSGKSTLAKHMNAILTPTSGQVLVNGLDTADENRLLEPPVRDGDRSQPDQYRPLHSDQIDDESKKQDKEDGAHAPDEEFHRNS